MTAYVPCLVVFVVLSCLFPGYHNYFMVVTLAVEASLAAELPGC